MNPLTDYRDTLERNRAAIARVDEILALHEQAQREIAELELTKAIRRDAAEIERLRADVRQGIPLSVNPKPKTP